MVLRICSTKKKTDASEKNPVIWNMRPTRSSIKILKIAIAVYLHLSLLFRLKCIVVREKKLVLTNNEDSVADLVLMAVIIVLHSGLTDEEQLVTSVQKEILSGRSQIKYPTDRQCPIY